jgi:hypothetical protein
MLTPLIPASQTVRTDSVPLVGPYLSFPYAPTAQAVSYKLSYRYWENELAGVE